MTVKAAADDTARAFTFASGNVDGERLGEIAERYGMEVVGPVPEGYA